MTPVGYPMGVIWIPIDTWWVSSECHTNTYWYPVSILGMPFLFYYYYYFVEEMLTEHLRCLKVTAHERDPKKADEDLETRSQNEGPKQCPSSLSLSWCSAARRNAAAAAAASSSGFVVVVVAASRLHAPSLKICLPLSVCCCWLGLENSVHRSCYKVSFFFRRNSFDCCRKLVAFEAERMSFSFRFVFLSLWFVSQ